MNRVVTLERRPGDKTYDRGERAIMVDGVQWGRTIVSHHGMHRTKHIFKQEGGGVIEERPGEKYPGEVNVRSLRRRSYSELRGNEHEWRPTEELVLDKARELVASGRLRHPDVVKAESKAALTRWRAKRDAAEAERKKEFRERACEALRINDPDSETVDRVVAAMEWAQTR
jgi:hypothetical protein